METINGKASLRPKARPIIGKIHGQIHGESQDATVELLRYWMLFRQRWLMILGISLAVSLSAGLFAKFGMGHYWRAEALITPVSASETQSQMGGGAGILESLGGGSGLTALLGLGGQTDTVTLAMRYAAIMNSYEFTTSLMDRYQLDRTLMSEEGIEASKITRWKLYKLIVDRFSYEFDYKTGSMSVYFLDRDPKEAKRILGVYLESLRDRLRGEEVRSASAAALSLEEEIRKTSDSLLRSQLYELLARQLQRAKLGQVQADFAFKVIEPPMVSDPYYSPIAREYAGVAGAVTLFFLCSFIVIRDWLTRARAHLAASELSDLAIQLYDDPQIAEAATPVDQYRPSR